MDEPTQTQAEPARPSGAGGSTPRVVVSGTAHLLGAVPHLLGYHPGRSVVAMASSPDGGGRRRPRSGTTRAAIRLTARFDLPAPEDAAVVVSSLGQALARAAREPGGSLLLHVFLYEADDDVATALVDAVVRLAHEHGHRLHDLVLVREGRYLPLVDGAVGDALEPGWLPVPAAADVPAVADLVLQGRFAAASRDDVVARVRRRDESAASATDLALTLLAMAPESYDALDALRRLGRWVVLGEDDPAPRDRARIAVALSDRWLRDAVMARWLPQLFTLEEVLSKDLARDVRRAVPPWRAGDPAALDRLLGVAARVPVRYAVAPLTVTGAVAWGTGEGTVANEAVDRALEIDSGYAMARLLREALDRGMPPRLRRGHVA